MMPPEPPVGGPRPFAELRARIHAVRRLVTDVRAEPSRPFQFPVALVLLSVLPVGVALAAIREASRLDPGGYLVCLAACGLLYGGAIVWGLSQEEEGSGPAQFFQAELAVSGLAIMLAGLFFLGR